MSRNILNNYTAPLLFPHSYAAKAIEGNKMSYVLNEYKDNGNGTHTLRITGVYSIDAIVDSCDVPALQKYSWSYEQAKGNVYTTDTTMEVPRLLGVKSPRVYLWKYVIYLRTGKVAKAWKRASTLNHSFTQGEVVLANVVNIADLPKTPQ